jgi:protoheme IX farnesyltransferase
MATHDAPRAKPFAAYVELTKPRILMMVLVTATLGYALPHGTLAPYGVFLWMLLGTGLSSGGAGALNHFIERETDTLMERTKNRPLPSGAVPPVLALALGIAMSVAGVGLLTVFVNPLAAMLSALTIVLYTVVYTPLKKVSWLNTPVGAVPGAIPPLIGWAAADNRLGPGAWVLFAILFFWQHPHFYAIAWMFREDYARGGFKMLPTVDSTGRASLRQAWAAALILIPVSLCPTFLHLTGWLYFAGAFALGLWFLSACVRWRITESMIDARRVLRVSVIYFPGLLFLILLDAIFTSLTGYTA